MRIWFIVAAALFQFSVLGVMAGVREWVVCTGETIHLRTAPIDPLDPFRGQYVRLDYEVSAIQRERWRGGLAEKPEKEPWKKDTVVYTALDLGEDGVAKVLYASDQKPQSGLFIRGRLERGWGEVIRVRYGVDAYFVQQGRGLELERGLNRDRIQVPLEMEVAVGASGLAVLKDHRWSQLGIGIDIERGPETIGDNNRRQRLPIALRVRLLNAADQVVGLVDLPDGRAFSLVTAWEINVWRVWRWAAEGQPQPTVTENDVRLLQPGEIYDVRIDLTDPHWFVTNENTPPRSLSGLEWGNRFRLIYTPPSREACSHLSQAALIWHGELRSRAFSGTGWID